MTKTSLAANSNSILSPKLQAVSDYFIALSNETHNGITNLKLQKLVYYVQAWHLAAFGDPVFEEDFQAWVHGPVVPSLYHRYKSATYKPLIEDKEKFSVLESRLPGNLKLILDDVVEEYFGKTAYELERLTHSEDPWINARGNLSEDSPSSNIIGKDGMGAYYRPMLLVQ